MPILPIVFSAELVASGQICRTAPEASAGVIPVHQLVQRAGERPRRRVSLAKQRSRILRTPESILLRMVLVGTLPRKPSSGVLAWGSSRVCRSRIVESRYR